MSREFEAALFSVGYDGIDVARFGTADELDDGNGMTRLERLGGAIFSARDMNDAVHVELDERTERRGVGLGIFTVAAENDAISGL